MTVAPDGPLRRSFVYRRLVALGADFDVVADCAVASTIPGGTVETASRLGLCDLSALPRFGFKGADALGWLAGRGIVLERVANRAFQQPDGGLCAVLAPGEALLLSSLADPPGVVGAPARAYSAEVAGRTYVVPRSDANFEFLICGRHAPQMFAKICAVDLRPQHFAPFAVAQTSLARSNVIVVRNDIGATPAYRLLGDSASAEYLWDCLIDAMGEFQGRPVGLDAITNLAPR